MRGQRFQKVSFLSVHTQTVKQRFQKVLLWRAFSKSCVFSYRFIVYVWKIALSVTRKLRFQMKTDTCGQGLSTRCIFLQTNRKYKPTGSINSLLITRNPGRKESNIKRHKSLRIKLYIHDTIGDFLYEFIGAILIRVYFIGHSLQAMLH